MAGEFTKSTAIIPAVVGTIANPDEYNQNIAGQSKDAIVAIDTDGNFIDGDIGDETLGANGTLINNIKCRNDVNFKFYNSSGVFQNEIQIGEDFNLNNLTINNKLNTQPNSATISSGAIAYTGGYMVVGTEGGASSDTLDTISGGTAGDRLLLRGATVNQDIIISDNTGNIQTNNSVNFTLEPLHGDCAEFFYDGSYWIQTARRINSDFLNYKGLNGYTYLPNGLIFQWGYLTANGTITFPIAFPNATINVTFGNFGGENGVPRGHTLTTTSFYYTSALYANTDSFWVAIGN